MSIENPYEHINQEPENLQEGFPVVPDSDTEQPKTPRKRKAVSPQVDTPHVADQKSRKETKTENPEDIYEKEIKRQIKESKSIEEIFDILVGVDDIPTSAGVFSGVQLVEVIKRVWEDNLDATRYVTKTLGLQKAVLKLRQEKERREKPKKEKKPRVKNEPSIPPVFEPVVDEEPESVQEPVSSGVSEVEPVVDEEPDAVSFVEPEVQLEPTPVAVAESEVVPETLIIEENHSLAPEQPAVVEAIQPKTLEYEEIKELDDPKSKFRLKINSMPVTPENYKGKASKESVPHTINGARKRHLSKIPRERFLESDDRVGTEEEKSNVDELSLAYDKEFKKYRETQKGINILNNKVLNKILNKVLNKILNKVLRRLKLTKEPEEPESLISARRALEEAHERLRENNPFFSKE